MSPDTEPVAQSLLSWVFMSLGLTYGLLLPLSGLICFLLVLVVVMRGKGPMAVASLLLIPPVPLLIGVFAAIRGGIDSYTVIAMSGSAPKPSEVALGISTALVAPLVGMVFMIPGYATAAIGALARSLAGRSDATKPL